MKFQDDCRDFIKKLKAVTKSKLTKNDALNVNFFKGKLERIWMALNIKGRNSHYAVYAIQSSVSMLI